MRAIQFSAYGPPSVMETAEVPEPHAGPGEIRIAVRASGVAAGETYARSGVMGDLMAELPFRTGFDGAGVVDELGEGVTGVGIGDEVWGMSTPDVRGTNADHATLVAWAPKPPTWSWAEAGGAAGSVETSVRVLDRLAIGAADTVLIQGASGATGSVATQFALARGAAVIGTASEPHHAYLRSVGATPTTYGPGLVDRVRELAPAGVTAVIDCAGGALPDLIKIAGTPSRVVTIVDFTAADHGAHLSHTAPGGREFAGIPADPWALHALDAAVELAAKGRLRIRVGATFSFSEIAAAHELSETRHPGGKIVLLND